MARRAATAAKALSALGGIVLVFLLAASAGESRSLSSRAQGLSVQIVNLSGRPSANVYVMLDNGSSSDGKLTNDTPKRLSDIAGGTFELSSISAGRMFFSYDDPVGAAEPPRAETRYDKVELTYPGVANLTAVDFFGIPFRLEALDGQDRSLGALGFDATTATIQDELLGIDGAGSALVTTRDGGFARILSPQLSLDSYPSFRPDIEAMAGQTVTLRGAFFGTPYQEFVYSGTFAGDGSIELGGTITAPNGGSPALAQVVAVDGSSLPSAIYTIDGPFTVGGGQDHVSDNNVYSVIYRDLLSGFAAGYMGGKYGNDSADWVGKPPFAAARAASTPYATFNEYAAVIYKYSDAYGFSFSDTLPKKVQLPLDGAATLRITILGDSAAPPPPPPAPPPPPPPPPPAAKCVVPDVKGKRLSTARSAIAGAHCSTGKVRRASSRTVKAGLVISQSPKAGRTLAGGRKIDLVVSRGKK